MKPEGAADQASLRSFIAALALYDACAKLTGVPQAIQICSTNSTVNDILNMAAIAAGRLGQIK